MNKDELKKKFSELVGNNCLLCYDCRECYDCYHCHDCYHCDNCYNCDNCLLCKNLTNKTSGYWLLNEEVSKEEFEAEKEAMGY